MEKWPEELEDRFFSEVGRLSDAQSNTVIILFCLNLLNENYPNILRSIFGMERVDFETILFFAKNEGKNFWVKVDNFGFEDSTCQLIFGYVLWAANDHYSVDGALEILDDLIDKSIKYGMLY